MSKRKYPSKEAIHEAAHAVFSVLAGVGVSRLTPQQSIKNVSMYTLYEQAQEAFLAQTTDHFQECGEPDHGAIVQILGYYANAVLAGPFFEHTMYRPSRIQNWFCFTDSDLTNPGTLPIWYYRVVGLDKIGLGYDGQASPEEGDYAKLVSAFLATGLRATTIFDTSAMPQEEAALRMVDWCLTDHPQYRSDLNLSGTALSILNVARLLEECGEVAGENPDFYDALLPMLPVDKFGMIKPCPALIPIAKREMVSRHIKATDVGADSFNRYAFTRYMHKDNLLPERGRTETLRLSLARGEALRSIMARHGSLVEKANAWASGYSKALSERWANPEICRDLEFSLMVGRKTG